MNQSIGRWLRASNVLFGGAAHDANPYDTSPYHSPPHAVQPPDDNPHDAYPRFPQAFSGAPTLDRQSHFGQHALTATLMRERTEGKLREEFIAVLGHDLRNPLGAIMAGGQLLEHLGSSDPKLEALAHRIQRSATRMAVMIDATMDFARGRMGDGIGVACEQVDDFAGTLRAIVEELTDAHPGRSIALRADVPCPVHCDSGRMQQVFSNLLSNALTHGSADGIIETSVRIERDEVVITVANDGEPIPPELMPMLFSPFRPRAQASRRVGLGLGLYISAQIVQAHGGHLTLSSTAEDGTRAVARIPVQRNDVARECV